MKSSILNIIISFLVLKIFNCSIPTNETEFFHIKTKKNESMLFDIAENKNKFDFLNIQIISCYDDPINFISIINNDNLEIFKSDITGSRQFILNITDQINNSLKINATSFSMYIKYQYIEKDQNIILPFGIIRDYSFTENSISFEVSPIVNNTITTYDLYYLGKINLYSNICKKLDFVLQNKPIQTLSFKGINYFNLTFENITYKPGLYLIKGDNINNISYTYFYHIIRVINRLGPFTSKENKFFNVSTESDDYYSLFTTSENSESKKYINIQILLCNSIINKNNKSHITILGEDNFEIFDTDLIASRQMNLDLYTSKKIKILATSPLMYIQYQFTNQQNYILPLGWINSYDFNYKNRYLYFNVTPVAVNTTSFYELYFIDKNLTNDCEKLEFSLNNKSISTLNITGGNFSELNFTFDLVIDENKNFSYYAFLKSNYVNETNDVYFYKTVNITNNYNGSSFNFLLFFLIVIAISIIISIIIYILIKKYGKSKEISVENYDPLIKNDE